MEYTSEEYAIYRKIQHGFLLEDAKNFVMEWIMNERDCDEDDITDEELERYDYEYLVTRYEKLEDCNVAFNDTWQYVVEEYMKDFEEA